MIINMTIIHIVILLLFLLSLLYLICIVFELKFQLAAQFKFNIYSGNNFELKKHSKFSS